MHPRVLCAKVGERRRLGSVTPNVHSEPEETAALYGSSGNFRTSKKVVIQSSHWLS